MPIFLSKAIDAYFVDFKAQYTLSTATAYRIYLHRLINFIGDQRVDQITHADLSRFILWLCTEYHPTLLNSTDHSPLSTYNLDYQWKCLRSFFRWIEQS
ncbi:MAG TPA: phage integrase N-terminal SAM-like domain-containing protein [Anaerolineaceae bacterium]